MKQILSIQSAVTCGFVGNSVAAPVITTLGLQPLLVDTISLAAHPGYGKIAGGVLDIACFSDILEAFSSLNILPNISSIVTGYLGDARQVVPIENLIKSWRLTHNEDLYILDPVMGDGGRQYVDDSIVNSIRKKLLPLAQIITPNHFELSLLIGEEIDTIEAIISAGNKILEQNPLLHAVVVTGISNASNGISDLSVNRQSVFKLDYAKRPYGIAGGGDLLTAILACWLISGHDLETAFTAASRDAHSIIDRSASAIEIDLFNNLNGLTSCY